MTQGAALDLPAQQLDPGAHDDLDRRVGVQKRLELGDRLQRRGQIGVPVADHVGAEFQRPKDPRAHRFGLAAIFGEAVQKKVFGIGLEEPFEHGRSVVGAAVVDEEQPHRMPLRRETPERVDIEPRGFVVTRDNNDQSVPITGRCPS